jgi:protein TonB
MKKIFILLLLIVAANAGFTKGNGIETLQDSSMVHDFPEQMAHFPGDADAMDLFIRKNLYYPPKLKAAGIQGKVYIQFIVEKDGSLSNITVRRGSKNAELDQEAINVIKKMPNWTPGSMRGKKVRVKQTVPVAFTL